MIYQNAAGGSLSERAYEAIKERILSLELRPGQFINEADLCRLTGMGRMPVHQAVHRLMTDGLLEVIPRKGIIIGSESANEVAEALEARRAVEPYIAALAAERATPAQIKELEKLLKQSRKIADQRFRREFMDLDRLFHAAVAEAAGNRMLVDAQRPMQERSARIWALGHAPPGRPAHDPGRARGGVRRHSARRPRGRPEGQCRCISHRYCGA